MGPKTKKFLWCAGAAATMLALAAMLLPALLPPRFLFHEFLTFKIRVTDHAGGSPVEKADVWILYDGVDLATLSSVPAATTDARGTCELMEGFTAKGTIGRSGQFDLTRRRLVVRATGYKLWDKPLDSVFGRSRDYYKDPRVLSCEVALEKSPPN